MEKDKLTKKQMQALLKELDSNWAIIEGKKVNDTGFDEETLLKHTQKLENKYFKSY